jgi:hypothetical protein
VPQCYAGGLASALITVQNKSTAVAADADLLVQRLRLAWEQEVDTCKQDLAQHAMKADAKACALLNRGRSDGQQRIQPLSGGLLEREFFTQAVHDVVAEDPSADPTSNEAVFAFASEHLPSALDSLLGAVLGDSTCKTLFMEGTLALLAMCVKICFTDIHTCMCSPEEAGGAPP